MTLVICLVSRKSLPRWLLRAHPALGITALICLWIAFALWQGQHSLPLDAGIVVLTLAFAAGGFMFSLRATRLPVPPFAIGLHGLAALTGCVLLIVGLCRLAGVAG
ncbi:MAG: hypothetical protein L0I62_10350 [Gammaproteobacteria bacterium]|nr:hypothetical protein [Gammaproteobacteria bacterium]